MESLPHVPLPPRRVPAANDPAMTDASILVGYKQPDGPPSPPRRGEGRTPWWLWLVTVGVFLVIVVLQQLGGAPPPTLEQRRELAAGVVVEPPRTSMLVLFGKLLLAVEKHAPMQTPQMMAQVEQLAGIRPGSEGTGAVGEGSGSGEGSGGGAAPVEAPLPPPAAERFRVAILAGEAYGAEEARRRLEALEDDLAPTSPLREDIGTALRVYEEGPGGVDPAGARALTDRHGWFGELLLSYGKDDADAFRSRALGQGMAGLVFLAAVGGGIVLALVAGTGLLIAGGVLAATGRIRSAAARTVVSRPASRVWLETFAVFLVGFLALKLVAAYAESRAAPGAVWPLWLALGGQWSLVVLVLWPLARGMSFEQYRGEVGWHRGRGLLREVGAGVLSYIAALPVYVGVALMVVMGMFLYRQLTGMKEEPPVPDNRVFEIFERADPAMSALLASLVVMWAPLVEETIFRGALFRAVRPGAGAVLAALITALLFALMHAYALPQLILVGTLGVVFALMREWRGSLLPSMTAHAVHNGMVMVVTLVMLMLARG